MIKEGAAVEAEIKRLLRLVIGNDEYSDISRMGGLTNKTYKVTVNGENYVVRIPGEGTEELIDRSDEKISTTLACRLGVDAEMLYFGDDGAKVTRYIEDAVTMSSQSLKEEANILRMAEIFKKVHSCGVDTGVPFEVFEMAGGYERIILDKKVPMYDDYDDIKSRVMAVKRETDASVNAKKVPCHNDPLCENWVLGGDRMYLIDWEYAGMNDGMWDVADVAIEAGFTDELDDMLLTAYLGAKPTVKEKKHFLASKIYVDYLWTLWAKTRVPYDGQPMEDWAEERYTRLKGFLKQYEELKGEN